MAMPIMIMTMVPMTIRVVLVTRLASRMPLAPRGHREETGIPVHAAVQVHVPSLNARAEIEMSFAAPVNSNREEWAEIAYDRALRMLDPA